jgi:DNA-binding NarL/FixJ family response regulator
MIRVLMADDHPLIRQGIRALLEQQPDMQVVGEAGDGEEAVRLAKETEPDVALMDIGMPKMDGLEATRQIKEQSPDTRILVLTIHDEEEYVEGLLKAGAGGYMLKSSYGASLVEAVRLVNLGQMVLDPATARALVNKVGGTNGAHAATGGEEGLSSRQMQLLRWLARGMTTREMAEQSGVSERTVKGHVA